MIPGLIMRHLFGLALVKIVQVTVALLVVVWMGKMADALLQGAIRGTGGFVPVALRTLVETPALLDAILPHAVLVAGGLVGFGLKRRNEVPVLMAAGLSGWQLVRPIMAAGFVAGLCWLAFVEPLIVHLERRVQAEAAERAGITLHDGAPDGAPRSLVIDTPEGPVFAFIEAVHAAERRTGPALVYRLDPSGGFVQRIDALTSEIGESSWRLHPRTPGEGGAPPPPPVDLPVEGRLLTATPADRTLAMTADLPGLIDLAKRTGRPVGRLEVRLHQALSLPVLLAVVAALASVLAIRQRGRAASGVGVAGTLLTVGFCLFVGSTLAAAMGARLVVAPALAVWIVPALGLAALAVLLRIQRS